MVTVNVLYGSIKRQIEILALTGNLIQKGHNARKTDRVGVVKVHIEMLAPPY